MAGQQLSPWDLMNDPNMYLAQQPTPQAPLPEDVLDLMQSLPQGPGSKAKASMRQTEVAPVSQSDYDDLVARLNNKGIESLKLQSEGIADLEQLRNSLLGQGDVQTDITPAMALMDSWSKRGGNSAESYTKPPTGEERQANLRGMQAQIQRAREGMSSQEMDLLKSQLGIAAQKEAAVERSEDRKLQRDALNQSKNAARQFAQSKEDQNNRESLIKHKQAEQVEGIIGFSGALNNYEQLVSTHGLNPTGDAAAQLQSAYSELETGYKEAKRLGALSGPDMAILQRAIDNAGGFQAWFRANTKGGAEGILSAVKQIRKAGVRDFDRNVSTLEKAYPGEATKPILNDYKTRFNELRTSQTQRAKVEQWLAQQEKLDPKSRDPRYAQAKAQLGK